MLGGWWADVTSLQRVRAWKVPPPPAVGQGGLACAVSLVSVAAGAYNRNPGLWAVETMAENEMMLAGG